MHSSSTPLRNPDNTPAPPLDVALVTIVIVNYNGGDLITQCLDAVARQEFRDFKVVVVDNQSTDASVADIRTRFPDVKVLSPGGNLGFAGGVNHALNTCALGTYVALLNPDAFPSADWLGGLVTRAQASPQYASFGSRMYNSVSQDRLDGVGDVYHVSGLPWRRGHGCPNTSRHDMPIEIFAPCAAAALYRVDALRDVGLLDEDFFLYVEDIDLGFRMQLAGYRSLYVPEATVLHLGSAIVGKHSDFQLYYGHRNLVWVYVKNMPGVLFWLFLPLHLALNLVTLLWFFVRGQGDAVWRAKRDAVRGLPLFWRKRGQLQVARRASTWAVLKKLAWNPLSRCA